MPSIADDETGEVDEPPDSRLPYSPIKSNFTRNPIRRSIDYHHQSLLTRALHSNSEDDASDVPTRGYCFTLGRPTMSNASLASTADLTSDTGMTSPSRTNTPSPPVHELRYLNLNGNLEDGPSQAPQEPKKQPRKRCIQFACVAKPTITSLEKPTPESASSPSAEGQRKTRIKFACPTPRSTPIAQTPPQRSGVAVDTSCLQPPSQDASPATVRKKRFSSSHSRSPRPLSARATSRDRTSKSLPKKKYITCDSQELQHDAARFHEFASDGHCDEDWIRETVPAQARKLTINDTLAKENEIRRLAAEAEEEAEQEEEELEMTAVDDDDVDNLDGAEDEDEDDDDDSLSGYATEDEEEDGDSDGYNTDEETGFADSDDENDGLQLWTPGRIATRLSDATPTRRASIAEQLASSLGSLSSVRAVGAGKVRRLKIRPGTPELPDSTDFVCGTLDEDRPMEEAYISCLAARRREKLHLIPQDIDPSFPASEPEGEGEEELYNPVKHASDDEDVWLHGEMDDLHHEQERKSRKKKGDLRHSPKRFHSPPPKRYHSPPPKRLLSPPPPKTRGRSPPPKGMFDRRSPNRMRSPPPPQMLRSPPASLRNARQGVHFKELASRPGLTVTKSLPRPSALFPNMRHGRRNKVTPLLTTTDTDVHIRGAIDIVKGLERKRQRRKEKYYQKYCNRARKGHAHERKPMPGMGCVRMRELGLIMAGKIDQGNYVLSI